MKYYVYILESQLNGSFYIGQTQNTDNRLKKHNAGYNKSTKAKRPWKIIASFELNTRAEAIVLEKKLKKLKKRESVKRFILERG